MPRPGGRPARAVNAATEGAASSRIACATAAPSSTRAAIRSSSRPRRSRASSASPDARGRRACRRDESARPADADALQHVLIARVGLDPERALVDRHLHPLPVTLHDDVRDLLAAELLRHDAADAPVAADDEVVLDGLEHTRVAPPLK